MFDPAASVSGRGAIAEQPLALKPVPPGLGRRVVVTGAAGFVGCHACRALAGKGWQVRALVRSAAKAAERLAHLPVEIRIGDIRDPAYLTSSMDGATAVVHLAAIAIEHDDDTYESANTNATRAVIESASNARVRRFVHMSQNGSDSKSPYRFLRSKGIAQDLVTASDLEWTVLRPSVIFGREDEFVNMLARLVRLTPFVLPLPDDGRARFQPIAVDDVAQVIAHTISDASTHQQVFPLGGSAELTLRQIAERILVAMNARRAVIGVPAAIIRPLVAALWHLVPRPPVTSELLDILALNNTVPDNALVSVFGITPTPFAPEELLYLRNITFGEALRSLFRN
ncbi:MAG TPA: NAD(P)H-binding protein [Gemmatimonadaceae bacterium]|nr:NAD(P)H-binding protein [Gemmatimonadaceae bacterium]